ncbi:MAG TPA: peptidylprolyl isomerase [Candidatus Cloacimonadota bacterium]|nr:peptidylprolyl isomerase [Candidatus Cloacimonadota bacterium]
MIVAIVNDYQIESKEYEAELCQVLHRMHLKEANEEAKRRTIEQLIDAYLLLSQAKESGIEVSQSEMDDRFVDVMLEYNSKQDFERMLHESDLTYDIIKQRLHNDVLIKKYIDQCLPTPEEIPLHKLTEIYEENKESFVTQEMVKAYHILIKGNDENSLAQIIRIRESIVSPQDFLEKASESSECPSCCTCGSLGFFSRGKMVKEFEDVAFNLKINTISEPVKTPFGYHLIMVTAHKESKVASFEEVKEALVQRLKQIDCELQLIRHLKKLRSEADIIINRQNL